METIQPKKYLDYKEALEVFKQVPIKTTGGNWREEGILKGRFNLQANPNDERFDSRYRLKVNPFSPDIFEIKGYGEDMKLSAKFDADYVRDPTMGGCIPASLLISGKRPRTLALEFDNHLEQGHKTWLKLINDYIPNLINAGYDYIPNKDHTIAEICATKDTDQYIKNGTERFIDKKEILIIMPTEIKIRTENVFDKNLVTHKVYKSICDLLK